MSGEHTQGTHDVEGEPFITQDRQSLRLGFARGIAPSKWASRWRRSTDIRLELVPLALGYGGLEALRGRERGAEVDVLLERTLPGEKPGMRSTVRGDTAAASEAGAGDTGIEANAAADDSDRHAMRLYDEAIALVVSSDHELAKSDRIDVNELALVRLLDHPAHSPLWPAAEAWEDPDWMPQDLPAALELVASGLGAILLPQLLARHLINKHAHVVIPVLDASGTPALPGSAVWATWEKSRDAPDVQLLAGILRGRRERSSRPGANAADGSGGAPSGKGTPGDRGSRDARTNQKPQQASKKAGPKPGSRGAQLAAAKEKAERAKAAKRKTKKRR